MLNSQLATRLRWAASVIIVFGIFRCIWSMWLFGPQVIWIPGALALPILMVFSATYFLSVLVKSIFFHGIRKEQIRWFCILALNVAILLTPMQTLGLYWFWVSIALAMITRFWIPTWSKVKNTNPPITGLAGHNFLLSVGLGFLSLAVYFRLKGIIPEELTLFVYFICSGILSFFLWLKVKWIQTPFLLVISLLAPVFFVQADGYALGTGLWFQDVIGIFGVSVIFAPIWFVLFSAFRSEDLNFKSVTVGSAAGISFATVVFIPFIAYPTFSWLMGCLGVGVVWWRLRLVSLQEAKQEAKQEANLQGVMLNKNISELPQTQWMPSALQSHVFLSAISCMTLVHLFFWNTSHQSLQNELPNGIKGDFSRGGNYYQVFLDSRNRDYQLRKNRLSILESSNAFQERQRLIKLGQFVSPKAKKVLWVGGAHPLSIRALLDSSIESVTVLDFEGIYSNLAKTFPPIKSNAQLTLIEANPFNFFQTSLENFDLIFIGEVSPTDVVASTLYSEEFIQLCQQRLLPKGRVLQSIRPAQWSESMFSNWVWTWAHSFQSGFDVWRSDLLPEAARMILVSRSESSPWDLSEDAKKLRVENGKGDFFFSNPALAPMLWIAEGDKVASILRRKWGKPQRNQKLEPFEFILNGTKWRRTLLKRLPLDGGVECLSDLLETEVPLSVGSLYWTKALLQLRRGEPQWRISLGKADVLLGGALKTTAYGDLFAQ